MAHVNITLSDEAHKLLRTLKQRGESFSDVVLRHFRPPADTCGELLERLEASPPPPVNLKRMEAYMKQRGRRSRRRR